MNDQFTELHMNAVKVKESQLVKLNLEDWLMEEKFKGIRCWYLRENNHTRLITRGGEDITWNFPHLAEPDYFPNIKTLQLDCELYDPSKEDEVVSGWAMTMNIDPDLTANCSLQVFDILNLHGHSLQAQQQDFRKEILNTIEMPKASPLQLVESFPAFDHRQYYDYIVSKKGEGILLKNKHVPYWPGKRSVKAWFKRKKRDKFDVVIMALGPIGEGKFSDGICTVVVGQYTGGILRPICNITVVNSHNRVELLTNPKRYLGKVISVWAIEQDPNSLALIEASWSGAIRIDKRPEDCIYYVDVPFT